MLVSTLISKRPSYFTPSLHPPPQAVEQLRNGFVNLAVNVYSLGEPGAPKKTKSVEFDPIACGPQRAMPEGFTRWDKIVIREGSLTPVQVRRGDAWGERMGREEGEGGGIGWGSLQCSHSRKHTRVYLPHAMLLSLSFPRKPLSLHPCLPLQLEAVIKRDMGIEVSMITSGRSILYNPFLYKAHRETRANKPLVDIVAGIPGAPVSTKQPTRFPPRSASATYVDPYHPPITPPAPSLPARPAAAAAQAQVPHPRRLLHRRGGRRAHPAGADVLRVRGVRGGAQRPRAGAS